MKLAQYLFLKGKGAQRVPILLLDDIFDKLDATRVNKIVQYVSGADFGQIFITDTHREHLDSILSSTQKEYKLYTVVDGVVHEE
jgi:DNA replication and repair protein RecF